MCWQQELEF